MRPPLFLESAPHLLESPGSDLRGFGRPDGNDRARLPRDTVERLRSLRIGIGAVRTGAAGQTSAFFSVSPLEEKIEKQVTAKDANG